MKQKIVFFGSGSYVIPVVEKLIPHGLDFVITTEKNPESKLLKYCSEKNIKTISVTSSADLISQFSNLKSQTPSPNSQLPIPNSEFSVAVLASYGGLIPDNVIKLFPNGIINIHPSLLPKYKGPSPIQYQLLNGETTVGVTLIKLDHEIDHGPIISQKPYNLQGSETSEDLLSILFEQGGEMVEEVIKNLENGKSLETHPQDHSKESWSYKIVKKDGQIDLDNLQAKSYKLSAMIKAYYSWPGVWFVANLKGNSKIIKLLPENRIQVEGKSPMSYTDFMNGFGDEGVEILRKLNLI